MGSRGESRPGSGDTDHPAKKAETKDDGWKGGPLGKRTTEPHHPNGWDNGRG